jgi:multiple sugar transport system substrate-binding protein
LAVRAFLAFPASLACLALQGCPADIPPADESAVVTITFKHGKLAGGAGTLEGILRAFEVRTPGVHVREELLPSSTDQQHQFYAMNLDSRTSAFDVLAADVIWVQEFARAGWIRDLDHLLPANEREEYFPAAIEAASVAGRLYAVPWYVDAGVLYYRRDLLERHGFAPPRTWPALVRTARAVLGAESDPALRGFVWQGRQYEGLVCVALEVIWGYGGSLAPGHGREAAEALAFLRDLLGPGGVSPGLVTTADEEATRHLFGAGRAVFMRNWPYAWSLLQREDSPVRGKVGLAPLPSQPGVRPASVLGGWMLAIPREATHPREAEQLIRYLTEPAVQRRLAQAFGYEPPRRSLYRDAALLADRPWLADVYPILETARPRPVTPYYLMLSEILQPEFSAALVGTKSPQEALSTVHRQIARLLGPAVGGEGGLGL